MKETRKRPTVGDTAWFVEWVAELGWVDDADHDQGHDYDKDKLARRMVDSREEAERVAREVFPLDQVGAVAYWPAEFVAYDDADAVRYPWAGFWSDTADAEYFEGE